MEALIAFGHPPESVWSYTPRQIRGFLQIANRRVRHEHAMLISITAMGARGDPNEMKRKVRELTKD